MSSNILGKGSKLDVVLGELVPSSNTRESRIRIVANAQDAPRTTDRRRNSTTSTPRHNITPSSTVMTPRRLSLSDTSSSSQIGSIPDSLRKESLSCLLDGAIMWDMVTELASLEVLFHVHSSEGFACDAIEEEMTRRGIRMPTVFEPTELSLMSTRNKQNAATNIKLARDDVVESLIGGYFVPSADELLHEWLADGKGYSNGRRVEAYITALNKRNLRHTTSPRVQ